MGDQFEVLNRKEHEEPVQADERPSHSSQARIHQSEYGQYKGDEQAAFKKARAVIPKRFLEDVVAHCHVMQRGVAVFTKEHALRRVFVLSIVWCTCFQASCHHKHAK